MRALLLLLLLVMMLMLMMMKVGMVMRRLTVLLRLTLTENWVGIPKTRHEISR